MFELDPRLQNDCYVLAKHNDCQILLMNNKTVPWIIIVPETGEIELCELDTRLQSQVFDTINILSKYIKTVFNPDKLNIGALGNVVSQLHIHVIGRYHTDTAWPKPVWGNISDKPYTHNEVDKIKIQLLDHLKTYK